MFHRSRSGLLLSTSLLLLSTTAVHLARADESVMIKELRHPGEKIAIDAVDESNDKFTRKEKDGTITKTDALTRQHLKGTLTIVAAKDGSATESRIEVDAASEDSTKPVGGDEEKKPSPYAGKTITLTRHDDGTVETDLKGDPSDDLSMLTSAMNPDQDLFADHPVAVGDVWDASKGLAKSQGIGPNDKLTAKCRLDALKTVNGKRMAEMTCSMASIVTQDDKTEVDTEQSFKLTVDIEKGLIVKADCTGPVKYSAPADALVQTNGQSDTTSHMTSHLIESEK